MAYADADSERPVHRSLTITTAWNEKELISQIPGARYNGREKIWEAPLAWATCVHLRAVFGSALRISDRLTAWAVDERRRRVDPANALRALTAWPESWPTEGWPETPKGLYPFQSVDTLWLSVATQPSLSLDGEMNAGGALLANDMGTGKTISTYAVLRMLNDMHTTIGGVLPALVISPNGVKQHWAKRTPTWFPDATPYIVPNTGPVKRKQLLNEARDDSNAIVFCNIEAMRLLSRLAPYGSIALARCRECDPKHGDPALKTSRCEVHRKEFNGFGFRTVVIDEAHRVRNATSKSTRAVWSVCHDPSVERRIALTGTSIAQHVGDLWSVMHAIAPLDYPVKSKWMDRVALFAWDAMGGMEVVGVRPDRRDEFFSVLDPRYRRMPIDVVLPQLPPFVREVREVELPAAQLRMYNDIKKKLTTRTESGELFIVPNQLTKSVRLQQLAASSVEIEKPDEDDILTWKVTLKEPSPKLDELMAVLEELGDEPCAIGSEHLQLINLAAARLDKADIRYGLIAGPVSTFDRERALDDLGTGRIRVLLFTLAAGGEGIDMSAVSVLIRLQRSWQLIPNIQSERRIRRIGSEKHNVLRVIDIITAGTVEVDQIERLNEKLQRLEEVNRDRETRRAAGMTTEELDQEEMHIMSSRLDVDK